MRGKAKDPLMTNSLYILFHYSSTA